MPPAVVERIIQEALRQGRRILLEPEAKNICQAYGMSTPDFGVARSASEAGGIADKVSFPVVIKIVSRDILHKTEAGGVMLDLKSRHEVEGGYQQIVERAKAYKNDARLDGVLVQHMAPKGVEVIVGGLRDSQFGPTILFGLGGIFVEVLKDVTFRAAPLTNHDSRQMISEIHSYPVLKGFRGQPPADEESIAKILEGASQIMVENPAVEQMDLNPVIAYGTGATVADARMILADNGISADSRFQATN